MIEWHGLKQKLCPELAVALDSGSQPSHQQLLLGTMLRRRRHFPRKQPDFSLAYRWFELPNAKSSA